MEETREERIRHPQDETPAEKRDVTGEKNTTSAGGAVAAEDTATSTLCGALGNKVTGKKDVAFLASFHLGLWIAKFRLTIDFLSDQGDLGFGGEGELASLSWHA